MRQLRVSNATAERQSFDVVVDSLGNSLNLQMREQISSHSIMATEAVRVANNIEQLTIAPLMAEAMRRISEESSVSSLFH